MVSTTLFQQSESVERINTQSCEGRVLRLASEKVLQGLSKGEQTLVRGVKEI